MLSGWLPFLLKKKRQYSAQQSCYPLYFLLFCLSVIYQVSTVNMYYFFLLPFDPLYPFLLLTTLPWGRKELDTTERLNWTEPLPLATTNMFSVSMSFFFIWLFFFLDSTYKRDHTVLDFSVWLISFSITPSRSIMLSKKWQNFLIFMAE